jgi:hypothetical protein
MNAGNYTPRRLLGAMFFIVAVTSILSMALFSITVGSGTISNNLMTISNKTVQVRVSLFIELITSVGIVVLATLLYVNLEKQNRNIALVALGWWIAEATILAVSKMSAYSLITLSLEYVKAGAPDSSYFQTLGILFKDADKLGYTIHLMFFSIGGILFYSLFYKSRSIPRVFSIWGLIAVSLSLIGTLLTLFDLDLGTIMYAMFAPNMLFELTIGVWLMAKGMRPFEAIT